MKVYINARFLTQGTTGVQQFAREICHYLQNTNGLEFVLLAPRGTIQPTGLQHLHMLHIGKYQGYAWEQFELPRFLARHSHPLLINLCNTAPLFYRKQFVTIHDLSFLIHPGWYSRSFAAVYRFMIPRIARKAARVITVSHTVKKQLVALKGVQEENITVLYNGLSTALQAKRQESFTKEHFILTVSSINPRKNLDTLISAFLRADLPQYRLLIAGAENEVFARHGFEVNDERVQFLGYVSDEELAALYAKAEVFASLSLDEGFGIPVLEAAAFGCKLLLSDIEVYRELFDTCGVFCPPTDPAAAAAAIRQSISGQPLNRSEVETLLQRYSYSASAGRLTKLVEEFF